MKLKSLLPTSLISGFGLFLSAQVEETPDSMLFYTYHPSEPLSKERVEAFSDGVYAIVATLLILDIWSVSILFLQFIYSHCPCYWGDLLVY